MKKIVALKLLFSVLLSFRALLTSAQQKMPNIIWITCEDISPYIGAYGNKTVKTPNIDQLAKEGIIYNRVYTTAGVCAPSRSAIITGMYQTSIGTQHMRTLGAPAGQEVVVKPYSAVIPDYVKCFPEFLRKAGYYCTNNEKQDYQFEAPVTVWDEDSPVASFRNRPSGMPFFSVFNFDITHESQEWEQEDSLLVNDDAFTVPPIYPDTRAVRHDMARMYSNIDRLDKQIGDLIAMLKADGLYNNTIIFFYSDHGGPLPWMKREVLERGTHIPFIVRLPGARKAGTIDNQLISGVDFAPTVLSLANIKIPAYMQGQAFLGNQKAKIKRKYVFAARDRMDGLYDRVRMVRDSRFRYIYNYMPDKIYYQDIQYRLHMPMMREILNLKAEGKLGEVTQRWFTTKPAEELYDVEKDPWELRNLANNLRYNGKLTELRRAFKNWTEKVGDMGSLSEAEMVKKMWGGSTTPPLTAQPEISVSGNAIKISCGTKGSSIGYKIVKAGVPIKVIQRPVTSWDEKATMHKIKNGDLKNINPIWKVYNDEAIPLQLGDVIYIKAMRIGYKPSTISYCNGKIVNIE